MLEVVIIKQTGITWMPDESLEPFVKELDDTAAPWLRWMTGCFIKKKEKVPGPDPV